jgi:hypothetical protein
MVNHSTPLERKAASFLKEPRTFGELGWYLWGDTTGFPRRGEGSHCANKFHRAAGKLLKSLQRKGAVILTVPRKGASSKYSFSHWTADNDNAK